MRGAQNQEGEPERPRVELCPAPWHLCEQMNAKAALQEPEARTSGQNSCDVSIARRTQERASSLPVAKDEFVALAVKGNQRVHKENVPAALAIARVLHGPGEGDTEAPAQTSSQPATPR